MYDKAMNLLIVVHHNLFITLLLLQANFHVSYPNYMYALLRVKGIVLYMQSFFNDHLEIRTNQIISKSVIMNCVIKRFRCRLLGILGILCMIVREV